MAKPQIVQDLLHASATLNLQSVTAKRHAQQASRVGKRMYEVRIALEKSKRFMYNGPCACGRNHYGMRVGGLDICPLALLMWCNVLGDCERARDLLAKNKKESIIRRVSPEQDATFVPEPYSIEFMLKRAREWVERKGHEDTK